MGRAGTETIEFVYPADLAYEANAARVLEAPAAYFYYTFKGRMTNEEMQRCLKSFTIEAKNDVRKCSWDGKAKRVITERRAV